jgi:hypothetical protein
MFRTATTEAFMRFPAFSCAAIFAFFLLASPSAFALSTDRDSGMNSDGSAKFSDPDDQRPGFARGQSDDDSASVNTRSITPAVSPGMSGFENAHSFNPQNQGPDAFDQAYSHK